MKNYKLLTLRIISKQADLILIFKQKIIKKTKITKNGKITIFGAITEEFMKIQVHLITKLWLLIRRQFLFNLANFIQLRLWPWWFLLMLFCLAPWFQAPMLFQEDLRCLFYISCFLSSLLALHAHYVKLSIIQEQILRPICKQLQQQERGTLIEVVNKIHLRTSFL